MNRDGLHITRPTAKYLLAMKVMASRKPLPGYQGDLGDIETLLRITKLRSTGEIEKIVESFSPDTVLPETVRIVLDELLEKIRPASAPKPSAHRPRGGTAR